MNFKKLFTDFNVPYDIKNSNKAWTNVKCPFCDDRKFHGGFNEKNYFHCWKCGSHFYVEALSLVMNLPRNEVIKLISNYKGRTFVSKKLNKKTKVLKLELPSNGFTSSEKKYLKQRKFNPKFLYKKYKVVGGGVAGRWKFRIIIPLIYNGIIVSWVARSILTNEEQKEYEIPRYKNLSIDESIINPKEILFNLDNCKKETGVLVEGVFDVMRLGDDFFCSFGTSLTESQISLIASKFKKVYILFDNEKLAQQKAKKTGLLLSSLGVEVEVIDAYGHFGKNDGAELNNKEVKELRKFLDL